MDSHDLILLYDGACGLCDAAAQFIARRDRRRRFRFVPQQSDEGRALLAAHGLDRDSLRTMVLIEGGRVSTRSTAALRIGRRLGGVWGLGYAFMLVPRFMRDGIYDWVARHRHRLWKAPSCVRDAASGAGVRKPNILRPDAEKTTRDDAR